MGEDPPDRAKGTTTSATLQEIVGNAQLALGAPINAMSDIVLISESVLQHFFHAFVEWGTLTYGWRIQAPRDTADIVRAEHVYRQLGLPECCSSTDGVHVAWMRAPSVLSHLYVGKEGFPTLQFNVSCDHTLKIVHVADAQPGARNDKTCILFDEI